ncbi:MAG: GNAT family N-acetyltransferase [Alteromonadales bacterium]|nr:GNAT family N-acetyltransferase [Alteromonadales bacterium]
MKHVNYFEKENIQFDEYVDFLSRTDLGSQYPKEKFEERVSKMLLNRAISITARDKQGLLIGVCFGQSDFAYFLFLTDLGVDRKYEKLGIAKTMVNKSIELAGGKDNITVATLSNEQAIGFYKKIDFEQDHCLLWKPCEIWTDFSVSS